MILKTHPPSSSNRIPMKSGHSSNDNSDRVIYSEDYYLILFADLIGSTEVASEQSPNTYSRTYIASFRWAANRAIDYIRQDVWSKNKKLNFNKRIEKITIIGDEVFSIKKLLSATTADTDSGKTAIDDQNSDIVASAVLFAYLIKLYWFVSPYNLNRLLGNQFTRDISVGIHIGPAGPLIKDKHDDGDDDVAGLHINIAKRIETLARDGTSTRIFASEDVNHHFGKWRKRFLSVRYQDQALLTFMQFDKFGDRHFIKGLPRSIEVFELKWVTNNNDLLLMLKEFTSFRFDTQDLEAEDVLQKLGKAFFRRVDKTDNTKLLSEAVDFGSLKLITEANSDTTENAIDYAKRYIENWFDAVRNPPKVFLDELFISTSYFIISCALYRYYRELSNYKKKMSFDGMEGEYDDEYERIVEELFWSARKHIEDGD